MDIEGDMVRNKAGEIKKIAKGWAIELITDKSLLVMALLVMALLVMDSPSREFFKSSH